VRCAQELTESIVYFDHRTRQFLLLADVGSFTSLSDYPKNKDAIGEYSYSWNMGFSLETQNLHN